MLLELDRLARSILLLSSVVFILALLFPVGAAEFALTTNWHTTSTSFAMGRERRDHDNLPEGIVSDNVIVFEGALGLALPTVADEPDGTGAGYSRLWLDLNSDGVWGADEHLSLSQRGFVEIAPFPRTVTDGGHTHTIWTSGNIYLNRRYAHISLESKAAFEGSLNVNGKPVKACIDDGDGDGLVIEFMSDNVYDPGARFLFYSGADTNNIMWIPLAKRLGFRNGFYSVDLAFTGDATSPALDVSLAPLDVPMGVIKVTGEGVRTMDLAGSDASMLIEPRNGSLIAPAGRWQVLNVLVDDNGQLFTANMKPDHDALFIDVEAGKTNEVNAGGPLEHDFMMAGCKSSGRFSLQILPSKGVGGLEYTSLPGDNVARPRWMLRRPGGRSIISGNFEYG